MLEVNKPIHVDDPYRLLQYERGIFDVVSPAGHHTRVVCPMKCPPDAEQTHNQSTQEKRGWWRIEKIASA